MVCLTVTFAQRHRHRGTEGIQAKMSRGQRRPHRQNLQTVSGELRGEIRHGHMAWGIQGGSKTAAGRPPCPGQMPAGHKEVEQGRP
jgi:hypothetical protein